MCRYENMILSQTGKMKRTPGEQEVTPCELESYTNVRRREQPNSEVSRKQGLGFDSRRQLRGNGAKMLHQSYPV